VNGYLLIPLFAATASTVLAVALLTSDPRSPLHRRACLLFAAAAWWAVCQLLWTTASDAAVALRLVRLSSLGWLALGPLALDVLLRVADGEESRARRALPFAYAISALLVPVVLGTDLAHARVMRTPFGWGYQPGPLFLLMYPFLAGCVLVGLGAALSAHGRSPSPAERARLRWLAVGGAVPVAVATVTDVVLPALGVQFVQLATASFACLGAAIAAAAYREGHALLAPGALAREILDTIPDGVALLDPTGRIRSANPELARLLGGDAASLLGVPLADRLRGRGLEAADEGTPADCVLERLDGGSLPVSAASRTLRDRRGLPFGRMLVLRDQSELAELRRRLVTAGRLAAVGELAAGIAHEINNPIAYVGSNLYTLRDYWIDLSKRHPRDTDASELLWDGQELIEDCLEGIARVKQIVHDVKGFAHAHEERAFVDVNALLDSALRIARPLLPGTARLERVLSDVPHVEASARHLQQVFLNLLTNAAQAIAPAGKIRVQTSRAAGGVLVRVEDDGCGMPPEVLERVFDPFFTTKEVGEGTGLGLTISYQIVRSHGGEIGIESSPGGGTRVQVFLPSEFSPAAPGAAGPTEGGAG
jgi:signal transduction histidine kinase